MSNNNSIPLAQERHGGGPVSNLADEKVSVSFLTGHLEVRDEWMIDLYYGDTRLTPETVAMIVRMS